MNVAELIAEILEIEKIDKLFAYPVNPLTETVAARGIRPIIVRQERVGVHMADAVSRLSSGDEIGVFAMQHGPGIENSFGGVAQAFGDSVPVLVIAAGYLQPQSQIAPNFSARLNYQHITKHVETITLASEAENVMRRAFSRLRNGPRGPVLVEVPWDVFLAEHEGPVTYTPVVTAKTAPHMPAVSAAVEAIKNARRPLIYAGQGVHYARAWGELKALAERLGAPVTTSLQGKSAFPETHALSLGSGGCALPEAVHHFTQAADVIFGIGCSFTENDYALTIPGGKTIIHATLEADHLNKDVRAQHALLGDAKLILEAMLEELGHYENPAQKQATEEEIAAVKTKWLSEWRAKLDSDEVPFTPYRVIRDLHRTVDLDNTIITHDSGSPRDQLSPFWETTVPLSYIGWGKTTLLGTGLGYALGAKVAQPDKLCINIWGDAAIGFTGMDFETAVRHDIPILSVLFNNLCMAAELGWMPVSTEKFDSTAISGDYAAFARALGGYGERVTELEEIIPAIKRGIAETRKGNPVLLEFMTSRETARSVYK